MLNKNYSDVEEIARAVYAAVKKLREEDVDIDVSDIKITIRVNKPELNTIDRELYDMTKEYTPNKEFKLSDKKVFVNLGGIDFVITTEDEEQQQVTVTHTTTERKEVEITVNAEKEPQETEEVEEVKEEKKPKKETAKKTDKAASKAKKK
jgi:hypothetical protein